MRNETPPTVQFFATLVHLSGSRRGETQRLTQDLVRLSEDVTLHRREHSYELVVASGGAVWVNGRPLLCRTLATGDLLELGTGGPVLRFRLHPRDRGPHKTVREAFADCLDCARYTDGSAIDRAAIFLAAAPREMARQTAPWVRIAFFAALLALTLTTLLTARSLLSLERRFAQDAARADSLVGHFASQDLETERTAVLQRLQALETHNQAGARVVAQASPAIAFLQGAYGFAEHDRGRLLRKLPGDSGSERATSSLGFDRGAVLERRFTGTAFVATDDGYLLTNRHLATPWAYDPAARPFLAEGLVPVLLRYVAYLPGVEQPVPLKVVAKSEETDAALLECEPGRCAGPPLALSPRLPRPGEEIIVLGYPTGISALVARADPALAPLLDRAGGFWEVARRLSSKRQIAPLATRGIVGQVTDGVIVYDAETTSGASGSPVLDLEGHVVALNTAVLGDFHGANMGIPAAHLRALLEEAGRRDRDGFHDAGRSGSAASPPRGLSLSR